MNDNKNLKRVAAIAAALRCCGSSPKVDRCKDECMFYRGGYMGKCIPAMTEAAATLIEQLTAEPPNAPLTLEELRGMDREPVRIEENGEYQYGLVSLSGCAFTPKDEVITLCNGDFYLLAEMEGNYKVYPIAYRRKPDGGGE